MAAIDTSIILTDGITSTLTNITNALNLTVSAFYDMQTTASNDIDTSSFDAVKSNIDAATMSIQEMANAASNIPPVKVPVEPEWTTPQNIDVFNTSGVERYNQEIQSATDMMNRLTTAQQQIQNQAANIDLFPANMVNDLNGINSRIEGIRAAIQRVQNNPLNSVGADKVNNEVERLRGQLSQALSEQESLNSAMQNMDISAANTAYNRLNSVVSSTETYIRDNIDSQGAFNAQMQEGVNRADNLKNKILGMAAAYISLQGAGKILNLSDTLASNEARLELIVDDGGSVQELQDKIFLSAQRARGDYLAVSQTISKLGLLAGDAFSSNNEMIAFAEQMNKNFVIGGASIQEQTSAMYQLTQAMAAGKLQGDEYRSIIENAPLLANAIEDYMLASGVKGTMKEWAADGLLTAEVIKNAMFSVADETNARFETMPQTFAQIAVGMKNNALLAFQPMFTRLNELANSPAFNTLANNAIGALVTVAGVLLWVFDLFISMGGFISDNWSLIAPIIYAVAGALAIYAGYLAVTNGMELISNGIKLAGVIAAYAKAAATGTEVTATTAATAAQWGLNTALLACPITWIVIAIIALIAIIYLVVAAVNKFAGTSISATGIIFGAFSVLGAFLYNGFVVPTWNAFAMFANFIANVFHNPVGAVKVLFYDMAQTVIGYILNMARAIENIINKIPGVSVNITGGLDSFYNSLEAASQKAKDESGWVEVVQKLETKDYGEAWNTGYNAGQNLESNISGFDPSSLINTSMTDMADYTQGTANNTGDIADNTGAMNKSLSSSEEDLKYLRDIAERDVINRFTTAEVKVSFGDVNNNVSNDMDLDGFMSTIEDRVYETLVSTAEKVSYA